MPRFELPTRVRAHAPENSGLEHTKRRDARMYSPSVASSEMTMLRKMEFVKSELGVRGPSVLMTLSMPLNAKKNAAI